MPKKIEISYRTIIFIAVFALGLWILFQIREVLLTLFVSLILMSSLNPSIERLEKLRIPRPLAIILFYLLVLAILSFSLVGIVPPLIEQTSSLIARIPDFFKQFKILGMDEKVIASQLSQFSSIPANIIQFIIGFFSNILTFFAISIISFYLLMERKNLDRYLVSFFGEEKEKEIGRIIDKIESKLGGWVRGELLLMIFVGILSYVGFRVVGLEYALPLAILAFLLEIIPNIGPTLSAVPAVLVGLTVSPVRALVVVGLCFLIQQIENSLLVPRIMRQVAGVNPLVSIISLAIGFKLAGVGGAILAIPTFIVIEVIASEISSSSKFKES